MTITGAEAPAPLAAAGIIGRALQDRGLRFVHWKSNSHLAAALSGRTDIDLYADPAQRDAVRDCLAETGALAMVSQPWARYPDVEDWLAFDAETGRFLHLHLHFALVTGLRRVKHLRLPWGAALLANTDHALDPVWPTPTAEMELMILLVRMWAKMPPRQRRSGAALPGHVRAEFDWLLARSSPGELRRLAAELLPGLDAQVIAGFRDDPPTDDALLAVCRAANECLGGAQRMSWPAARLRAAGLNLRALLAKEGRKLRPATVTGKRLASGGLVVAFVGSDGSGKSTLTADTRKWLRYKLDVHGFYMGSGDGSTRLVDRIRHALKPKKRAKLPKAAKVPGAAAPAPRPQGFGARLLGLRHLSAIRGKVRDLRQARRLAAGGSMVVLDRFPQSQFPGINDGPRLQQGQGFGWAARAECAAFTEASALAPDLVIKLLVSAETGHARKPDHNVETLKRKAEIIRALTFPQTRVVEIDAGQPLPEVILAARRAIWQALQRQAHEAADAPSAP